MAIEELLGGSKRRLVQLPGRRDQVKVCSELRVQRLGVVPNHIEPTATGRSLRAESADDNVTTAPHRADHLADIGRPVRCGGQKMKNRAIMPQIVGRGFQFGRLEPLSRFPVVRDLSVDRSILFENLKRVYQWVPIDGTYPLGSGPRIDPAIQELAYPLSRCMSCCLCMETCPQI